MTSPHPQTALDILDEKLARLQHAHVLETDVSRKMQLEYEIEAVKAEISQQDAELEKLSKVARDPRLAPLLRYLINRRDQELILRDALKQHQDPQQPLILFIHGDERECGDKFIERLERHSLAQMLPVASEQGVSSHYFACDRPRDAADLHRRIWADLGEKLCGDMSAEPTTVARKVATAGRPVLLHTDMSVSHWQALGGAALLEYFLDFWAAWPTPPSQRLPWLVCLHFVYQDTRPASLWDKLRGKTSPLAEIRQTFAGLTDSGRCVVLPELNCIDYNHVRDWARTHRTEEVLPKIRGMFEGVEGLPMEVVADALAEWV